MFDARTKIEFLHNYVGEKGFAMTLRRLFNFFEPYENEWGKDLACADFDQLRAAFDQFLDERKESQYHTLNCLHAYYHWRRKQGLPVSDALPRLHMDDRDRTTEQYVSGPEHLNEVLRFVFSSAKPERDALVRACLWLAYAGLRPEEAMRVRNDDVDLRSMRIHLGGLDFPVYAEAVPDILVAMEATQFRVQRERQGDYARKRAEGDLLLRTYDKEPKLSFYRIHISRVMAGFEGAPPPRDIPLLPYKLSFYHAYVSGHFFRMFEMERRGLPIDVSVILRPEVLSGDGELMDFADDTVASTRRVPAYTKIYNAWKDAFYA